MRLINIAGRAALEFPTGAVDLAAASDGRFGPDPQRIYDDWDAVTRWVSEYRPSPDALRPVDPATLGSPVPRPAQIFAIGLNYRDHALEANLPVPEIPVVFAKFPASVTGPTDTIPLPEGAVDFETELVVVIGRRAESVTVARAWDHVAGVTLGQDLSDRVTQWAGGAPQQFSLGKSFSGFSPMGPALVTPDEFADRESIALGCSVNGAQMQESTSAEMIFSIPELIEYLSAVLPLLPGDAIFTGTPSGIGFTRDPKVLLRAGDVLVSEAEAIGQMRHTFADRAAVTR